MDALRQYWRRWVQGVAADFAATKPGREAIASVFVEVLGWVAYAAAQILTPIATVFARAFLRTTKEGGKGMAEIVRELMVEITGGIPSSPETRSGGAGDSIVGFGREFASTYGRALEEVVAPAGPQTPEQARDQLSRLLGITASFKIDDWSDHALLELVSLGQLSWLADLSGAVGSAYGLDTVGRRAMRTLFRFGVQPGLEIYLNRLYGPERVTVSQAVDAWQKELLSDGEVIGELRDRGFDYERATLLLNLAQRDFTLAQAAQLRRLGLIDDSKLEQIVRRQGYGAQRAELVGQLVKGERAIGLLEEIADQARRLFREGRIPEAQVRELLREAHYTDPEVDLALVRDELALQETVQLTVAQVLDAYEGGVIDEGELRDRLRARRYGDEEIDILLATRTKRLSPAQVIDALTRGLVDRSDATERLQRLGYRSEDIAVLLDLRVRRLSQGQIIDLLSRGQIDPATARTQLQALGFGAEVIDLLLAFQRKALSPGDITAALLRGLISEREALERLEGLGYPERDARLLLALRFQLLSFGQILDAYEAGTVGRESAAARLAVLGFTGADADLLLRVVEAQLARRTPPAG